VGVVELPGQPDLAQEAVGRDADQQLRVKDLEGDLAPLPGPGEIDARVAALADLALDLVLPLEGAAVLLGIDAILDMARTSVNVVGNCLATAVVARWEGVKLT